MRALAAVRRAALVMTIEVLAAGTATLVSGCAARTAQHSASRAVATRRAAAARLRPGARHGGRAAAARLRPAPRHGTAAARPPSRGGTADAALAAALAPLLRGHPGRLAAGVIDQTSGVTAVYHASWPFDTASIVKADILAVLLMQHQQTGTALSPGEQQLSAAMIEDSDNDAATVLWDAVEGGPGLEAGNAVLGLRHTRPDASGAWGLTATTVADQLRLLTDLTSPHSPLKAASRAYELGLMRHVEAGQDWGVTAAGPGSSPAVKNGWLPIGPGWVINSIGVVTHAGHRLLIAVLSDGQPGEASGIRQAQAAARAAADTAATASRPPATTASDRHVRLRPPPYRQAEQALLLTVSQAGQDAAVAGSEILLTRMAGNVIDNAVRHAHDPFEPEDPGAARHALSAAWNCAVLVLPVMWNPPPGRGSGKLVIPWERMQWAYPSSCWMLTRWVFAALPPPGRSF